MTIRLTRDHQLVFAVWNAGIARARRDYQDHPTAFDRNNACSRCAGPVGANPSCRRCVDSDWARRRRAAA